MLTALTNLNAYKASKGWSNDDLYNIGDVNLDGRISNADIQAELDLVASLGGGSVAGVPEPTSLILMIIAAVPGYFVVRGRRKSSTADSGQDCEGQ